VAMDAVQVYIGRTGSCISLLDGIGRCISLRSGLMHKRTSMAVFASMMNSVAVNADTNIII
jgi:hypothetical protein